MLVEPPASEARCSFCGKQVQHVRCLVASSVAEASGGKFGNGPRICDECLMVCEEIQAETASS